MSQSFNAASGLTGSITINGVVLKAESWDYDSQIELIPVPSFGPRKMEYAAGKVTGVFQCAGTWNFNVNPFSQLLLKPGNLCTIILRLSNAVVATSAYAIVQRWHITDQSDGTGRFEFVAIPDFSYTDFGGTEA